MVSRLMLNIQNPRLLEEPTTGGPFVTVEVGTLVTVFMGESELTESSLTTEDRGISTGVVRRDAV